MKFVHLTRPDGSPVWVNLDRVWYMYPQAAGTVMVRTRTVDDEDDDPEEFIVVSEDSSSILARAAAGIS